MPLGTLPITSSRTQGFWKRAYLSVKPHGIHLWSTQDRLVGHVIVHNFGRLPARGVRWFARISLSEDNDWKGFSYDAEFVGNNVIPPGGRSDNVLLSTVINMRDGQAKDCFLYVWGRILYQDGFEGPERRTDFCHRYNYRTANRIGYCELPAEEGRHHPHGNDAD